MPGNCAGLAFFTAITNGEITREHYVAYLRETYHLVGHTSRATALVPPRLGDERPELREWFEDVARTEQNHDLFCVKDLKELGLDPATALGVAEVAVADDIVESGNTSAASIPPALTRLIDLGRVRSGDPVLLLGFGAGLGYAAQVIDCP